MILKIRIEKSQQFSEKVQLISKKETYKDQGTVNLWIMAKESLKRIRGGSRLSDFSYDYIIGNNIPFVTMCFLLYE